MSFTGGTAKLESGMAVPDSSIPGLFHFDVSTAILECGMAVPTFSEYSYFYLLEQSIWICYEVRNMVIHIKHIKNHPNSYIIIKFHSYHKSTYLSSAKAKHMDMLRGVQYGNSHKTY